MPGGTGTSTGTTRAERRETGSAAGAGYARGVKPIRIGCSGWSYADWRGPAILTLGTLLWAAGAVYYSRSHPQVGTYLGAAVEMLVAGAVVTALGLAVGEGPSFHLTASGAGALAYLIVFGSLLGYSAYNYALAHASATVVGTYTYVNPVVAVLLGWLLLHEQIDARVIAGMCVVLLAVIGTQVSWRPARLRAPAADD